MRVVSNQFSINVAIAGRPAWRNAMTQWQWRSFSGSAQMSGVTPAVNPGGGYAGRIDAWNGFTRVGNSVYIAGMGGHTDYAGNEAYKIDLSASSPAWTILRQPTPAGQISTNVAYYADGRPSSGHTYYALQAVGNELLRVYNMSQWGNGQSTDFECVAFDLATNDWRPQGTYPDAPSGGIGRPVCKHPTTEIIYVAGGTRLHGRATDGTWTNLATYPGVAGDAFYYTPAAVDTTRNKIVIFNDEYNDGKGYSYDIAGNTMSAITFTGASVGTVIAPEGHSVDYVQGLDRFVLKTNTGSDVYLIHPTTYAITTQATTGGTGMSNAVSKNWNRFQRVPDLGGFFYLPNHASVAWFLATE